MVAVQVVSGVPAPEYFVAEDHTHLESTVSRILFVAGKRTNNLLHLPVFAVLCWLWCWSLGAWTASRRRAVLVAVSVSLAFGVLNELSQAAVPTRYAAVSDALMNAGGVAVGMLVFLAADRFKAPKG